MNTRTLSAFGHDSLWRRINGMFGISAQRVSVRTEVPWYVRVLGILGVAVYSLVLATFFYLAGQDSAGMTGKIEEAANQRTAQLETELAQLRREMAVGQGTVEIEQATQRTLASTNASLAEEVTRLKEELAVFRKVSGSAPAVHRNTEVEGGDLLLDQINVRPGAVKGSYRYNFMVALQGARRGKENRFDLQIAVTPRGASNGETLILPRLLNPGNQIVIRNFKPIQGEFNLPEGVDPASIEIRLVEDGAVRSSKRVTPS